MYDDCRLTAVFQDNLVSQYQNIFILVFIGAKDDGDDGWPVMSSPATNKTPNFYGQMSFLSSNHQRTKPLICSH